MTIKVISEEYRPLLKALCDLEAMQFRFKKEDGPARWSADLLDSVMSYEREDPGFNYVTLESISNMGLTIHAIKISSSHFDASRNLIIRFPMTPVIRRCSFEVTP